jgi:hypothetical protein
LYSVVLYMVLWAERRLSISAAVALDAAMIWRLVAGSATQELRADLHLDLLGTGAAGLLYSMIGSGQGHLRRLLTCMQHETGPENLFKVAGLPTPHLAHRAIVWEERRLIGRD